MARKLKKGEENPLLIKVAEGESEIPDRNIYICELGIKGSELPHDLPEGTEIELTININESRELSVTAYISLIDLTLNARSTFKDESIDIGVIESNLNVQIERAKSVADNCTPDENVKITNTIQSVSTSLRNGRIDEDEKRKASKQLKDLTISLDQLEQEKKMPQLTEMFRLLVESAKEIINDYADKKDISANNELLQKIEAEGQNAILNNDKQMLIRANEQIESLKSKAIYSNPNTWVYKFDQIANGDFQFIDMKEAEYYIHKGKRSIELDDIDELKRCINNLMLLLPTSDQVSIQNNISGITR